MSEEEIYALEKQYWSFDHTSFNTRGFARAIVAIRDEELRKLEAQLKQIITEIERCNEYIANLTEQLEKQRSEALAYFRWMKDAEAQLEELRKQEPVT